MKDGGSAFPYQDHAIYEGGIPMSGPKLAWRPGLSLRDYFAAAAIHGMAASGSYEAIASCAYILADAMLAERDKVA